MPTPVISAPTAPTERSLIKRSLSLRGRTRRRDYWIWQLVLNAVLIAISFFFSLLPSSSSAMLLFGATGLLLGWVVMALQVRRLHDVGLTGYWALLPVPFGVIAKLSASSSPVQLSPIAATALLSFVLLFLDGVPGANRYEPDPKRRRTPDTAKSSASAAVLGRFDRSAAIGVAGAFLFLVLGSKLAELASRLVPQSLAVRLGNSLVAQAIPSYWRCTAPGAERVLMQLAERMAPGAKVKIIYTTYPGADGLTAPGGRIIIGQEAVRLAERPEEVAALLAHELAHSLLRHPERKLLSSAALQLLPGGLVGTYGLASYGWKVPYSRALENEADAKAARLLSGAGIAPKHLASMLNRLEARQVQRGRGKPQSSTGWRSTHPATPDRIARLIRYPTPSAEQHAISADHWLLVQQGCEVQTN
ncbi:DUF805 domain-containing protein [Sphingomonas xinjiangensis]|uniref:Uncharacterized membrane protein YhaH (DUF805 family) n=1 Tax=Sphingomonas xinjiangensis TaxID=643568 RepID=A0A840YF05_9SPHN|nr:uncharacterized membrane protein YhaH (DUF805 family) [Sphingomonas xinjiangensis]